MAARRVALIGHSGAGKSSCLSIMGLDCNVADMDAVFKQLPSLAEALGWLASEKPQSGVVVVSNYEQMLKGIVAAKQAGLYPSQFSRVHFVYLHWPLEELRKNLTRLSASGSSREPKGVEYTIAHYESFHSTLFVHL